MQRLEKVPLDGSEDTDKLAHQYEAAVFKEAAEPHFDEENLRVVGFCPTVIDDPYDYFEYLSTQLFPVFDANQQATRLLDLAIIKGDLNIPLGELKHRMHQECAIPLGGRWKDYYFVMNGANSIGRRLSTESVARLFEIVLDAKKRHPFEAAKEMPVGFQLEGLNPSNVSLYDLDQLVELFTSTNSTNSDSLRTLNQVDAWLNIQDSFPVVIRDNKNKIVSVASGTMNRVDFGNRQFSFFKIGETATDPKFKGIGLNRRLKEYLTAMAASFGADSVHIETKAGLKVPNLSAARSGFEYHRTLLLDQRVKDPKADFDESSDPTLSEEARDFSSHNVWAITPASELWSHYVSSFE